MRLHRHPDSEGGEDLAVEVEVARTPGGVLSIVYVVTGDVAGLRLPAPSRGGRADELWRHSCFEAFLRAGEGEGYLELNFAPSTQWAAYRFDAYRAGMGAADVPPPRITAGAEEGRYALTAVVALGGALPADAPWRLAVPAVLEDTAGRISYWAAAHAPGKPDFHHPDCFALDL